MEAQGKAAHLALASLEEGRYTREEFLTHLRAKGHPNPPLPPGATGPIVEWGLEDRIAAAVEAIRSGAHVEEVARVLGWRAFEALAEAVIRAWGYRTTRGLRMGRWEVDILAEGPQLLLVECKRWRRPAGPSTLGRVVESTRRKAGLLSDRLGLPILPLVVTMQRHGPKLVQGIPVVPIASLQSFLQELPQHTGELGWVHPSRPGAGNPLTRWASKVSGGDEPSQS